MADLTPVSPVVAAVPAPAAPAVAGAAPAAPGQDFLGQLTAALKTLKGLAGAVTGTPVVPDVTPTDIAPAQQDDVQPAPVDGTPAVPDDVMELLASLGLVPVPQPIQPETAPSIAATPVGDAARDTSSPAPAAAPASFSSSTVLPITSSPAAAPSAKTSDSPTLVSDLPRDTATPEQPPVSPASQQPVAHEAFPYAPVATAPSQAPVDAPGQSAVDTVPVHQPQVPQASQQQQQQPTPLHPGFQHTPVLSGAQDSAHQGDSQDTGADHESRDANRTAAAVVPAKSEQPATVQHDVNVPMTVAASAAQPQAATNAQPAEVVNQIAQQVDLYRLPGSKGVRIQLHPEDLGGVQVTLKYASGGNLELHISVEHAATGALVQEGIGQLRDALATQGFHPDRLVMSVSAAGASSQMDLSSNNNGGSYRSDSGFAAFTQNGQSGQQRDTPANTGSPGFGWSSSRDASPTSAVATIAADLSTSRIDYRV